MKDLDKHEFVHRIFAHKLKLTGAQIERDSDGQYVMPLTQALWSAFKLGIQSRPTRGRFLVCALDEYGLPSFPAIPWVHEFLDVAKQHQRLQALGSNETHLVFQQISVFRPPRHSRDL